MTGNFLCLCLVCFVAAALSPSPVRQATAQEPPSLIQPYLLDTGLTIIP